MAKNFYFENFENSGEQSLIEDLIIESIRIYGIEAWYIPRTLGAKDDLLNEDDLPIFDSAFQLEMYIKNVEGFEGEGDLLSRFGLEIRDSMVMTVANRVFEQEVGYQTTLTRPREGDLLYFPLNNKIFEIMHAEHEAIFYQMGKLQMYDLRCELFEYSNQRFQTGQDFIDNLYADFVTTGNTAVANVETVDPIADNYTIETEADELINFTENNPFGENQF